MGIWGGVCPPFSQIVLPFGPFPKGSKSSGKSRKTQKKKGLFSQITSDLLKPPSLKTLFTALEAGQQRYWSYRAILAAIVSQSSLVLVFVMYRATIARYIAKWGIAQMCLCGTTVVPEIKVK